MQNFLLVLDDDEEDDMSVIEMNTEEQELFLPNYVCVLKVFFFSLWYRTLV